MKDRQGKLQQVDPYSIMGSILVILFVLTSCNPSTSPSVTIVTEVALQINPVVADGEPEIRQLPPEVEQIPNCSGGNVSTIRKLSVSNATSYFIEWEINHESGTGATVGVPPLPVNFNIQSAFSETYVVGINETVEKASEWELDAEPNSIREVTVAYTEKWQPGYVDVMLPTGEQARINVVYRVGIDDELIDDVILDCTTNLPVNPTSALNEPSAKPTIPAAGEALPVNTCEPAPSFGLVNLWEQTGFQWSVGIWGSPQLVNFTTGLAIIDTADPDFTSFQLWVSPCDAQTHEYVDGVQFWPLDSPDIQIPQKPLTLGTIYYVDYMPANSGKWALGNPP